MIGRIVEIANDSRHLSLFRGFLVVQDKSDLKGEVGRVPLDDILAVVAHAHGLSYTNSLLVALAERDIPFVLCDDRHNAVGVLWPVEGHHQQASRFDAQIAATSPSKKALWSQIVKSKISLQCHVLELFGKDSKRLQRLVETVRSGDSDNNEAQAARIYWKLLFGEKFIRDRAADDVNALLNYGYTVLRSAMARATIAAGLHPSIGLHHRNGGDAMRLVDDLMEPYRPLIDAIVSDIARTEALPTPLTISSEMKKRLVGSLFIDTICGNTRTPVMVSMQNLATSLALFFLGKKTHIVLPEDFEYIRTKLDEEQSVT